MLGMRRNVMGMTFVDPVPGLGVKAQPGVAVPPPEKIQRMNFYNIARTAGYENMRTFLDILRQARSSRSISDSVADIGRRIDELSLQIASRGAKPIAEEFHDAQDQEQIGGALPARRVAEALELSTADRTTLVVIAFASRMLALAIARSAIDGGSATTLRGAFFTYTAVRTSFHVLLWMLATVSREISRDEGKFQGPAMALTGLLYGVSHAPVTFVAGGVGMDLLVGSLAVLVDRRTTDAENRDTGMNLATDLDRLTAVAFLLHAILVFRAT